MLMMIECKLVSLLIQETRRDHNYIAIHQKQRQKLKKADNYKKIQEIQQVNLVLHLSIALHAKVQQQVFALGLTTNVVKT